MDEKHIEAERAKFEAHCTKNHDFPKVWSREVAGLAYERAPDGGYANFTMHACWLAWQARATQESAPADVLRKAVAEHIADLRRCVATLADYPAFAGTAAEVSKAADELTEALRPAPAAQQAPRPECFEFAMEFLGEPESSALRAYVERLEAAQQAPATTADTLPIASLNVDDDGNVLSAYLYAPGLPAGLHDVWAGPVQAPAGWQWVPIEPTAAMTAAACLNLPPMEISSAEEGQRHAADAWAAMLAAAPQQQGGALAPLDTEEMQRSNDLGQAHGQQGGE